MPRWYPVGGVHDSLGTSAIGNNTYNGEPRRHFTCTADADAHCHPARRAAAIVGTGQADALGAYSIATTTLAAGTHAIVGQCRRQRVGRRRR